MTVILKVLAEVEILIPSYGFCPVPPCEEFAENVCDEFFSLPIYPQYPLDPCTEGSMNCSCATTATTTVTTGAMTDVPVLNCTNLCTSC